MPPGGAAGYAPADRVNTLADGTSRKSSKVTKEGAAKHPLLYEIRQSGFLPRQVAHPVPPGESRSKDTRYLDIHEDDPFDEAQFAAWVKQASALPGERM